MSVLSRLIISDLRNIASAELQPGPGFNVITGLNGSGKTSVLEGIYLLSLGRSFRSHLNKPLIRESCSTLSIYGETAQGLSLGVSRALSGQAQYRLNGDSSVGLSDLAQQLPVQLLNTDTLRILEGSPKDRRAFMDWGVFHVKHHFLSSWRRTKRALLNRNTLLKQQARSSEIEPWTREFVQYARIVDQTRSEYLSLLCSELAGDTGQCLREVLGTDIVLKYQRGWDDSQDLYELLMSNIEREKRYGHTLYGPHRADLGFYAETRNCADLLSRGQLKLLIAILKISQARILLRDQDRPSLILIDDLPSELDRNNQGLICDLLEDLGLQVFVTAIETEALVPRPQLQQGALFHVKHGKIERSVQAD